MEYPQFAALAAEHGWMVIAACASSAIMGCAIGSRDLTARIVVSENHYLGYAALIAASIVLLWAWFTLGNVVMIGFLWATGLYLGSKLDLVETDAGSAETPSA